MSNQTDTPNSGNVFNAEHLIEQARTYLAFGDQVHQFTLQLNQTTNENTDWGSAIQQHFSRLKETIAQSAEDPNANPDLARLWTQTADMWQQSAASLDLEKQFGSPPQNAAGQAYQRVQDEYLNLLQSAARQGLDLMQQRLNEQSASGEQINSLRELYNLWVDCNEKTYGQMLRTPEYAALNGRLLNALMTCYSQGDATS